MSDKSYVDKHEKPEGFKNGCLYCGRDEELRLGGCFECADLEAMLIDKMDMYENDYSDWTDKELLAFIIRRAMSYKEGSDE